jgi:predicted nuclease of restriction endonuclease-like (RecB) superfamily
MFARIKIKKMFYQIFFFNVFTRIKTNNLLKKKRIKTNTIDICRNYLHFKLENQLDKNLQSSNDLFNAGEEFYFLAFPFHLVVSTKFP